MLTQRMQQAFSHTTSELGWIEGSDATMQQGVFQRVPKFSSWEDGGADATDATGIFTFYI